MYNFSVAQSFLQIVDFLIRCHKKISISILLYSISSLPPLLDILKYHYSVHLAFRITLSYLLILEINSLFTRLISLNSVPIGIHFANTAIEVSSEVKVDIDIFVPSQKYQLKPLSISWFAFACAVAIDPGSTFFRLYRRDSSDHNTRLFVCARNNCKHVLI